MMVEHNQSTYNGGQYNNVYKFNGKELDDATGMYYYGARYYDPRISIFVSVDPLAEKTMTPYQYVNNNPIMFTDPTGMSAEGLSPIYGLDGKYLGNDENGFEGEVIFMDEKMYFFLGGRGNIDANEKGTISHIDAKTFGRTLDEVLTSNPKVNFSQKEVEMVNESITHIVSQMSDIGGEVSGLHNGKTSAFYGDTDGPQKFWGRLANDAITWPDLESFGAHGWYNNNQKKFTVNLASGLWEDPGQFTVNNIQNHAVHELEGHRRQGISGKGRAHAEAYNLQINHSSFKNTTQRWKNETIGGRDKQLRKKY